MKSQNDQFPVDSCWRGTWGMVWRRLVGDGVDGLVGDGVEGYSTWGMVKRCNGNCQRSSLPPSLRKVSLSNILMLVAVLLKCL